MKRAICVILLGFFVSLTPSFVSGVFAQDGYQTPPAVLAALVDAPATPGVSVSPDDSRLLLMTPRTLPSISDLAQPELRLAGRRINPRNNGPSRARYYTSLSIAGITGAIPIQFLEFLKMPKFRTFHGRPMELISHLQSLRIPVSICISQTHPPVQPGN